MKTRLVIISLAISLSLCSWANGMKVDEVNYTVPVDVEIDMTTGTFTETNGSTLGQRWVSNESPKIDFYCPGGNNMVGGSFIFNGHDAGNNLGIFANKTYQISVESGYVIAGYTIKGVNMDGSTSTITAGSDSHVFTTEESTFVKTLGEYASSTSFNVTGTQFLKLNEFTVHLMMDASLAEPEDDTTIADTDPSTYSNTIYASKALGRAGEQVTLSLNMRNDIEATGFQMDIYLPDGVSFALDEDSFPLAELSLERTTVKKTDYFNSEIQTDGALRVLCNSTKGYAFSGNDGEVATVVLDLASTLADGDYPIIIRNIVVTDATGNERFAVEMMKSTLTVGDFVPVYDESYNLQIIPQQMNAGTDDNGVELLMKNKTDGEIKSVEFDMVLPAGISLYKEEDEYVVDAGSRFASTTIKSRFACEVEENVDGSLHISAYFTRTTANYVFSGTSGDIALLILVVDDALADGIYTIELKNIIFNDDNSIKVAPYKASVLIGTPTTTDAVLYGSYTSEAIDALNVSLSTNKEITYIDLSNAVDVDENSTLTTANPNTLIYLAEGQKLANEKNLIIGNEAESVELTDGYNFHAPKPFVAKEASYTRTVSAQGYYSIVLPYAAEIPAGVEVERFVSLNEDKLTVDFAPVGTLEANVPYIFKGDANAVFAAFNAVIPATPVSLSDGNFTGALKLIPAGSVTGKYALKADGSGFGICSATAYVPPFRAYFDSTLSARELRINHQETTEISGVTTPSKHSETYDMQGRRVLTPKKGIYVVDGKKVVFK